MCWQLFFARLAAMADTPGMMQDCAMPTKAREAINAATGVAK